MTLYRATANGKPIPGTLAMFKTITICKAWKQNLLLFEVEPVTVNQLKRETEA